MKWILMGIGWVIVDAAAWDLPPLNFLGVQVGGVMLFIAGAWSNFDEVNQI